MLGCAVSHLPKSRYIIKRNETEKMHSNSTHRSEKPNLYDLPQRMAATVKHDASRAVRIMRNHRKAK